ncbi:MAG: hypothetical protein ACM3MB_01850 [Acidobacteriota bacterium]
MSILPSTKVYICLNLPWVGRGLSHEKAIEPIVRSFAEDATPNFGEIAYLYEKALRN